MNDSDRTMLARLEERLGSIDRRIQSVEADTTDIKAQMNRWRGAAPVVLLVGGIVGWAITSADTIKGFFK